jgi:RHS repeat-associated protein
MLIGVVSVLFTRASAQVATGAPPFSSSTGGSIDSIDLGNLNVHIQIPIMSRAGRGLPFNYAWSYDSSIWYPTGTTAAWTPIPNWGWRSQTEAAVGYISYSQGETKCFDQPPGWYWANTYGNFVYHDGSGTPHGFGIHWTNCSSDNKPHSGTSGDGSGMSLNADTNIVTLKSGATINAPSQTDTGSGTITDSNGNYISVTPTNITDTLGSTALSITGSPSPTQFSYTGPQGNAQNITITYSTFTVKTNFGCSNIAEYSASNVSLATKITLPDNTFYSISYEPTPGGGGYTGRIQSITLPTGGTIVYTYGSTNDGASCTDGSTVSMTRTTPDSTTAWQYSRKQVGTNWQTTITDPARNDTDATFNGIYELERNVYTGSATSGTLLATVDTCYNGSAPDSGGTCLTTTPALPFTQVDTYKRLPSFSGGVSAQSTSKYDATYGRLTETDEFDFGGVGGGVGSQIRQKTITYATLGNNINDRPYQVSICPGICTGSNFTAQTTYAYDGGTLTTTSGTPQHSSVTGARGNLTQVTSFVATGSTLSKSLAYYDTGGLYTSTDVNSAVTKYTFSDSTSSCGNSFPTNIQLVALSLTRSMSWNCVAGVQTGATDENGNSTSVTYNDTHFWRPTSSKDAATNQTNYTYTSSPNFTIESTLSVNSGNSVVDQLTTLDSLARPHVTQVKQGPTASNYDSVETDYDALGRAFKTSMPYSGTAGQAAGVNFVTTSFDGAGRTSQLTDAGTGFTSYDYITNGKYNDLLVSVGPAPAGENLKQRQLEYDGAGRLASVCEVTGMSGGGSCSQKNGKTGFLTNYTYDVLDNILSVHQNAQSGTYQPRTYTYDGLGRLTSETDPESGTTNYYYDSIASGNCAGTYNGDLIKRVDAVGNVTCYTYDALHRMKDITYPTGSYATATAQKHYVYDTATVNGAAMANAKGRLAEAYTGTSGSKITDLGFSYSVRGENTDVYELTPHSGGYYHTTVGYFENGAVKTFSGIPGQTAFTYGVDGEARPATAVQGSTNLVSATSYNSGSQPLSVTLGVGDSDNYGYDNATGRMTGYTFTVGSTPKSVAGTLTWNPNGTLSKLAITDGFNSGGTQTCKYGDPTSSVAGYDDLGRLIKVDCGASVWQQNFSFDAFGNLTKTVPTGGTGVAWNPGYNPANNHYTLSGTSYDSNGNLFTDTFHTYAWDAEAHPATIDSSTCGTNGTCVTYDALGRMVEKNVAGVYSEVLYSPLGKTAVMNGSTIVDVYVPLPGGETFHMVPGGQHFWHPDWLGSIRLSSSLQNRTVIYDRAFAPFGEVYKNFGSTANNDFTGDTQDAISGTYDTVNRELNPSQGRWLSPDPAGLGVVDSTNSQTWNRYAYVSNDPLRYVDPLGLVCSWNIIGSDTFYTGPGGDHPGYWTTYYLYGWNCSNRDRDDQGGGTDTKPANNTPQTPQQKEQQCLNNFYNSKGGKAVQFGSPMALLPGWNPQWGQNLKEWGIAIVGKLGGLFGSGAMSGTTQLTTLSGTTTVGSALELGTGAVLGAVEKVAPPAMAVATAVDVGAHINCSPAEPGPSPDMPGGGLP